MKCTRCSKEYERYQIEFVGTLHTEGAVLCIGKDEGKLKSDDSDLCSECMIKAIGAGAIYSGSIKLGTVWTAEPSS